jgi:acyl carrier protein
MKENVIQMIANIIKVTPNQIIADEDNHAMGKVSGWDSLAQLSIMTEIEDEYELDLSIDEMENMDSVKKILIFLEDHINTK